MSTTTENTDYQSDYWEALWEELINSGQDSDYPVATASAAIDGFLDRAADDDDRFWLQEIKRNNLFFESMAFEVMSIAASAPPGLPPERFREYLWDSLLVRMKHNDVISKKLERMFAAEMGVKRKDWDV